MYCPREKTFGLGAGMSDDTPGINAAVNGSFSKLLVSCMRAVAQAMATSTDAARSTRSSAPSDTVTASYHAERGKSEILNSESMRLNFRPHLQSITQSTYFILTKLVPASLDINTETFDGRRNPAPFSNPTDMKTYSEDGKEIPITSGTFSSPPRIKTAESAAATSPYSGPGAVPGSISQQTKVWSHALRMLSAVAAYDSHALLGSWPLFLSDSQVCDRNLDMTVNGMLDELRQCNIVATTEEREAGDVNNTNIAFTQFACSSVSMLISSRLKHVLATALPTTPRPSLYSTAALPPFKNPTFLAAMWSREAVVRAAAVACLRSMIEGLPLEKWLMSLRFNKGGGATPGGVIEGKPTTSRRLFNNSTTGKITASIMKMLRLVVLLMSVERDEGVVSELCKAAHAFVRTIPLASMSDDNSHKTGATEVEKEKPGICEGTGIKVLEQLVTLLFREALLICCESPVAAKWVAIKTGQVPDKLSSTDISQLRGPFAAIHTLQWIDEVCNLREKPLRALHAALIMPTYCLCSDEVLDMRTCNEFATGSIGSNISGTLEDSPILMFHRARLAKNERFHANLRTAEKAAARVDMKAEEYLRGAVGSVYETFTPSTIQSDSCFDSRGKFLWVLSVVCGLHAEEPLSAQPVATLPFSNAARQLQLSLLSRFTNIYYDDIARLRRVVLSAVHSECNALKLLGIRMLTALLGDKTNNHHDHSLTHIGGLHLIEIIVILLHSACHQDHLIRGQAVSTFGQLQHKHWEALRYLEGFFVVAYRHIAPKCVRANRSRYKSPCRCFAVHSNDLR